MEDSLKAVLGILWLPRPEDRPLRGCSGLQVKQVKDPSSAGRTPLVQPVLLPVRLNVILYSVTASLNFIWSKIVGQILVIVHILPISELFISRANSNVSLAVIAGAVPAAP